MGRERPGECAAVARLQDRASRPRRSPRRRARDGSPSPCARAGRSRSRRLLVHQQVEVAAPVALLDVGEAVEGVGERRPDLREQLEPVDRERRLAAPRLRRLGRSTPTMSPRWTSTSPVRSTGQRSWIRPERSTRSRKVSLPMSRRASTRPASRRSSARFPAGLEPLGLGADGCDLVTVREALRQLLIAASSTLGGRPRACDLRAPPRSRDCRRRRGFAPNSSAGRRAGRPRRRPRDPGRAARCRSHGAARRVDTDSREVPVRLGHRLRAQRLDRSPVGEEAARRLAHPDRRRDERAQHRADMDVAGGRAGATARRPGGRRRSSRPGLLRSRSRSGRATAGAPHAAAGRAAPNSRPGRPGTHARAARSRRRAALSRDAPRSRKRH